MASSLGPKVGADLTMESASKALIPKPELSELKEDSATGFDAKAASKEETKNLMAIQIANLGTAECDLDANNAASDIKVADSMKASAGGVVGRKVDNPLVVELAPEIKEVPTPQVLIDVTETTDDIMRLIVIVSMISPFADSADTLIHAGDFVLEVSPTTTIREIKFGITNTFEICYEDMALVYIGKFLSDARSVEYYFIENGQTLHLLVESPNQLFKKVFEVFTSHGLSEEKAWFATRSFIHIMHTKYHVGGLDDTPTITQEQLIYELDQLHIPDTDDSDNSSADEDEDDCSCDEDEDDVSDEVSDINDADESDVDEKSNIHEDEWSDIDEDEPSDNNDDEVSGIADDEMSDNDEVSDMDNDEESDDGDESDTDDDDDDTEVDEDDTEVDEDESLANLIITTHVQYVEIFEWI